MHCAYFVAMMLNAFPAPKGFLKVFSPQEFVTGRRLNIKKDCRVPFRSYIEASTDTVVTNNMSDLMHVCITLGPSSNLQGFLKCFDLLSGQVVKRRMFKVLPLTQLTSTLPT